MTAARQGDVTPDRCPGGCPGESKNLGPLPGRIETFGGWILPSSIEPGFLWHCSQCDLKYRAPYLTQPELSQLYDQLPESVWAFKKAPSYWADLLAFASAGQPGRRILDVGCSAGDFLAWLPQGWRTFGVEPCQSAAARAIDRGVKILGPSIDSVSPESHRFDCILISDVIEHMRNPLDLLRSASRLLEPGGRLLFLTGASDAFWPRFFGRYYWYINLPEHVSWMSRRWFKTSAEKVGLSLTQYKRVSTIDSYRRAPKNLLLAVAYVVGQWLQNFPNLEKRLASFRTVRTIRSWASPPWFRENRDHLILCLTSANPDSDSVR